LKKLAGLTQDVEQEQEVIHGNHFQFFCPKRFNRYPRFTIFFKRDQAAANNQYVSENTVSLSPQFLSYLMDKNDGAAQPSTHIDLKPDTLLAQDDLTNTSQLPPANGPDGVKIAQHHGANLQMEEAVTAWNQRNDMVQNYDPFEKVMLVKGIDNSILTSFRTLKRENNTVSDTFKIVHQKFLPSKHQGQALK
jgi:hypothetical protein